MTLSKDIEENYKHFKNDFVDCSDFLVRKAKIGDKKLFFAACDGLIDSLQLSQMVVSPILKSEDISIDNIKNSITNCVELNEAKTFADCYYYIMSGFAIVVVDGKTSLLLSVFKIRRQEALMSQLMKSPRRHLRKHLLKF